MSTIDYVKAGLIFLILIFGLVFTLTYTNIVHCNTVGQSWCNMYWYLVGAPRILVVFGNDGMGNENRLMSILADREILGLRTQPQILDHIKTTTYLEKYKMVIVTKAKTMSDAQIEMFYDYATHGGILIWTGDAGTSKQTNDKKLSDYNYNDAGPWTRINKSGNIIPFGELISVEYLGNFCGYVNCASLGGDYVGVLRQDPDSVIAGGIAPKTQMYGDFALTNVINNTSTVVEINIDYGSNMIGKDPKDSKGIGNLFPLMIRSQLGKNIIYISAPIEYLVNANDDAYTSGNTKTNIPTTIRKMFQDYFGIDYGIAK